MKKSYAFKRTLAGVLAVLTVAAYVPANVGGILAGTGLSLTANAAEDTYKNVVWTGTGLDDVSKYLVKVTDGTTTVTNFKADTQKGLIEGKEITVESKIPLTIFADTDEDGTYEVGEELVDFDAAGAADTDAKKTRYNDGNSYKLEKKNGNFVYTFYLKKATALQEVKVDVNNYNFTRSISADGTTVTTKSGTEDTANNIKLLLKALKKTNEAYTITAVNLTKQDGVNATLTAENYAVSSFGRLTEHTFESESPFKAYVVKPNNQVDTIPAEYDSETASFVCKVTIPDCEKVTGTSTTMLTPWIVLDAITGATDYTYKAEGNKLYADGTGVNHAEVASIKATIEDPDNTSKRLDLAEGEVVANGKEVKVDFTALKQFIAKASSSPVTYKDVTYTVKKNGESIDGKTEVKITGEDATTKKFVAAETFTAAGKYDVEMKVRVDNKDGGVDVKTLTTSFTIGAKDEMIAGNIQLSVPEITGKDGKKVAAATYIPKASGILDIIVPDDYDGSETISFVADNTADEMSGSDVATSHAKTFGTDTFITVVPFDTNGDLMYQVDKAIDTTYTAAEKVKAAHKRLLKFALDGTTDSNKTGRINTMTVLITDPEYGGSNDSPKEVTFKWRLVKESDKNVWKWAADSQFKPADGHPRIEGAIKVGSDEASNLESLIFDNIVLNQYSRKEISFEYLTGMNQTTETDALDARTKGLPTAKGEYSVFFIVDGLAVDTINVKITSETIRTAVPSVQLTKTFGEVVDLKGYYFKDANGNKIDAKGLELESGQKLIAGIYQAQLVQDKKTGDLTDEVEVNEQTGKYKYADDTNLIEGKSASDVLLAPGKYIVVINNCTAKDKAADKEYTIGAKQYIVTINKKKLTPEMVLLEPLAYTGSSQTYKTTDLKASFTDSRNKDNKIEFSLTKTGGTTTATKVGAYTISVEPKSTNGSFTIDPTIVGDASYKDLGSYHAAGTSKASYYFEDEIEVDWHIVGKSSEKSGLAFDTSATTMYDAGRIHFEVTKDSTITGTIDKFGIILDKNGLLPAPKAGSNNISNDEMKLAKSVLQYGNGLTEGNQGDQQRKDTPNKYGVNIKVVSVDIGVWARPYVVTTDGNIYYGTPIYRNVTEEATAKLQLKLANPTSDGLDVYDADDATAVAKFTGSTAKTYQQAVTKQSLIEKELKKSSNKKTEDELKAEYVGSTDIKCGYNIETGKYYIYSSMKKMDEKVKANVIQSGVVYDKFGLIGKDGKLVSDDAVTVEKALTLDNALDLTSDSNKGKRAIGIGKAQLVGNSKLSAQEYGANITPADGVTGVWVRAYVKLSETLTVYTDPIYIQDLSSHYIFAATDASTSKTVTTAAIEVDNYGTANDNTTKQAKAYFRFNVKSGLPENLTFKSAGTVYDLDGKFLKYDSDSQTYEFTSELMKDAKKDLILNNGFASGSKNTKSYVGYATPKAAANGTVIPVVGRSFIVFETKDGNTITVYSNVFAVQTLTNSLTYKSGTSRVVVDGSRAAQ